MPRPRARGPVVVGLADLDAPLGQVGGLGGVADGRHDAAHGHPSLRQLVDDQTTVLSVLPVAAVMVIMVVSLSESVWPEAVLRRGGAVLGPTLG
ncbi:hypothetical protein [Streptomyces milbemycinicus]|uniref:hypothetical protein n=1 Tax=Streptomyces milbemycinicus TaxID=476552 RepID=UPI003F4D2E32